MERRSEPLVLGVCLDHSPRLASLSFFFCGIVKVPNDKEKLQQKTTCQCGNPNIGGCPFSILVGTHSRIERDGWFPVSGLKTRDRTLSGACHQYQAENLAQTHGQSFLSMKSLPYEDIARQVSAAEQFSWGGG